MAFSPDLIRGAMDPLQDPTQDPNWGAFTAAAQPPGVGPQAIRQAMTPYAGPYSAGPMAAEDQAAKFQQANQAWNGGGDQLPQHTAAAVQQLMSQTNDPSLVKQAQDLLSIGPQTYAHDYQVSQFLLQRGAQQQMQQDQQRQAQAQNKQAIDRAQYHQNAMENMAKAQAPSYAGMQGVGVGEVNDQPVAFGPGVDRLGFQQGSNPADVQSAYMGSLHGASPDQLHAMSAAGIPGASSAEGEQSAEDQAKKLAQLTVPAQIKADAAVHAANLRANQADAALKSKTELEKMKQEGLDQRNWVRVDGQGKVKGSLSADQVMRGYDSASKAWAGGGQDPAKFPDLKTWAAGQGLQVPTGMVAPAAAPSITSDPLGWARNSIFGTPAAAAAPPAALGGRAAQISSAMQPQAGGAAAGGGGGAVPRFAAPALESQFKSLTPAQQQQILKNKGMGGGGSAEGGSGGAEGGSGGDAPAPPQAAGIGDWLRDKFLGPSPVSGLQGPAILGQQSLNDLQKTAPANRLDPRSDLLYGPSGEIWDQRMGDPPADRQWLRQPWAPKPGLHSHEYKRGQFPLQTVNGVIAAQG